ncbi:MAG: hypothetical protein EP330_13115 [Deltaproteobacteria bacterium]|nr:MAG: hypothetical protein EP330_13115 [Deltaproteobacteria bacterium]
MTDLLRAILAFHLVAFVGIELWLLFSWARWRWLLGNDARVGIVGVLRMLARETRAVYVIASYYVRAIGRTGLRVPPQPQGRPVLAVHGFTQNGTNMWGIRQEFERRGRPTLAVHLGRPLQALERYTPRVVQGLQALLDLHEEVDVVCHSMGGVVLRLALAERPDLAERVRVIVTLGSPHLGTHYARGLEWVSADTRQLATGSRDLDGLPALGELAPNARVLTVSGGMDLIVYPNTHSHEQGGEELHFPHLGHCGLIVDGKAVRRIADEVAATPNASATPP